MASQLQQPAPYSGGDGQGDQVLVIRQQETYNDLIKGENIPDGI
ncbi:MAG: hypothetical protein R2864_08300 [Syntrophotaleaceae bacterium]